MYKNAKIAVIIAAAGSGTRMGSGIPKQYREIGGKSILARTVHAFDSNVYIDQIFVVTNQDYIDSTTQLLCHEGFKKVRGIIPGGAHRQDSIFQALKEIPQKVDLVLVHDGARPFIQEEIINALIAGAFLHGAAAVAVPAKDTIKVAEEGVFTNTPDRSSLYYVQTPQGFHRKILLEAYESAMERKYYGTDDSVLVEKLGKKVYLVKGDYNNIKITTIEDLIVGEAILESMSKNAMQEFEYRTGTGFDVHRLVEGKKLILGGVEIPFEKGLHGHSDADVLTHAIMDALLGACALGDIGKHFPDKDPRYKGISSLLLLKEVGELVKENGFQ
jgi:2-C-methyl-D-erythritol 4-phosphate cytidylyltransferase/2-C-methyl-D-erythritol 2,4-cyclodiphosphate synthase